MTAKQGSPGIEVLAWKTWHSSSLPHHPLPKKTTIRNCFWHHSIGLSLFLPTPHRNGAVDSRLCEYLGEKGGYQLIIDTCLSQKQLRSQKASVLIHMCRTQSVHRELIQLFCRACAQEHTDAYCTIMRVMRLHGHRCTVLGSQWTELCTLAQLTSGMSKSWVQRSPKWMS